MAFSSLIFLFFFFALTMLAYAYAGTIRKRNMVLVIASLIFYMWAAPKYLPVMILMAVEAWGAALFVSKKEGSLKRIIVCLGIGVQILALVYFKYLNPSLADGLGAVKYIIPIGISLYTLRMISYMIDVYRGEVKAANSFLSVLLYCSLFHLSIGGPIVRFGEIEQSLNVRRVRIPDIGHGINRFTIGLFKAAVLAKSCGHIAETMFPIGVQNLKNIPALGLWFGAFAFMLQIYLTFSAYSDMAIGMGLMVGFRYKENFNYPYTATSVRDFCRRWYITLRNFIYDYVYVPLGGEKINGMHSTVLFIGTWLILGLWYGPNWNGLACCLFYAIILILEKKIIMNKLNNLPNAVRHIYTLAVICFGWIIFKFTDLTLFGAMLKGMFGLNRNGFINSEIGLVILNNLFLLVAAGIACTPLVNEFYKWMCRQCRTKPVFKYIRRGVEIAGPVVLLLISTMALIGEDYTMFLYF